MNHAADNVTSVVMWGALVIVCGYVLCALIEWIDRGVRERKGKKNMSRPDHLTDRELLFLILERLDAMSLDFTKVNASVAALSTAAGANNTAGTALVASHTDPADQTQLDAIAASLDGIAGVITTTTAAMVAATTPPAAPPPTA